MDENDQHVAPGSFGSQARWQDVAEMNGSGLVLESGADVNMLA
jgi:hypothetical protein